MKYLILAIAAITLTGCVVAPVHRHPVEQRPVVIRPAPVIVVPAPQPRPRYVNPHRGYECRYYNCNR